MVKSALLEIRKEAAKARDDTRGKAPTAFSWPQRPTNCVIMTARVHEMSSTNKEVHKYMENLQIDDLCRHFSLPLPQKAKHNIIYC